MAAEQVDSNDTKHSVLNSSFPVLLPRHDALFMSEDDFQAFLKKSIRDTYGSDAEPEEEIVKIETDDDATTAASDAVSPAILKRKASNEADNLRAQKAPFLQGLEKHGAHYRTKEELEAENRTLTTNQDLTNISSKSPVVDLFYDLSESKDGADIRSLLYDSWSEDPLLTLKIIFNVRSIHLGKSNRIEAYRAFGWLADYHPLTLLANLKWLVRPVIAKKPPKPDEEKKEKKDDDDDDFDMIDAQEADPAKAFDIRYGVSHGYWKDLLNLLVFAANDELTFEVNPKTFLQQRADNSADSKRKRNWDQDTAREHRRQKKKEQNERVQEKINNDPYYRALHFTVARLFAEQLKEDKALLDSGKKSNLKKLSLAAKWAPTFGEFHDKHTFIQSSIAEILFPDPASSSPQAGDREQYLRHVRELYRQQYASPLRKALNVVERDVAAEKFENIKYERVPSLAMNRYTGLFMKKDWTRFKEYVHGVAKGNTKISGATLLPSTLISKARKMTRRPTVDDSGAKDFKALKAAAEAKLEGDVIDGQWNTLVNRIREAGTLQSSIAVCDVSGSMENVRFKDGSCPMDSAIGLSLIIAETTAPPFGGGFISFSETPTYLSVGGSDNDTRGLVEKVRYITGTPWGFNTDFVSVFEDVILPMAVENKLKQEDMVKQVFVFSDMQFDEAARGQNRWTTSFERIKAKYAAEGYEMPRMIFWNLAAGNNEKPVTMDDVDTALVSGYSQGMLRAFLETGTFDLDDEEEVKDRDVKMEGESEIIREVYTEKKKIAPISVVKKAVGHKAYDMLEIVD